MPLRSLSQEGARCLGLPGRVVGQSWLPCPALPAPGQPLMLTLPAAPSPRHGARVVLWLLLCFTVLLYCPYSVAPVWTAWSHGIYSCPCLRSTREKANNYVLTQIRMNKLFCAHHSHLRNVQLPLPYTLRKKTVESKPHRTQMCSSHQWVWYQSTHD